MKTSARLFLFALIFTLVFSFVFALQARASFAVEQRGVVQLNESLLKQADATETPVPSERVPSSAITPTVPPPSDPDTTQTMVVTGIVIVLVILLGLWINRTKLI
jgi:cbb3-type cytochrome oxidase subunit 3